MRSGVPISEFVEETRRVGFEAFVREHGEAFLLFKGTQQQLKSTHREWQHTEIDSGRRAGGDLGGDLGGVIVFPMPQSVLSPWTVNVGRVSDNELVLDDASVSTWHAAFSRDARGGFCLNDVGSRGGTFINEVRVGQRPMSLGPGDMIRLGAVVLTFLTPGDLYHLARNLAQLIDSNKPTPRPRPRELHTSQLFESLTPGSTGAHPLSPTVPMTIEAVELIEAGHYDRARKLLEEVRELDPAARSARLWIAIANARELVGARATAEAVAAYEEVLAIDEHHAEAHQRLRVLRARLARGR